MDLDDVKPKVIISTHTLTWSVTIGFLPEWATVGISTHTLTWSVTGSSSLWEPTTGDFNSHAHVERDKMETVI